MDFSTAARDLLTEHGHLFGTRIRQDRASARRWATTEGGELRAAGVGGDLMGRGANVLIIDDYFKNIEEALSETVRRKMFQWYLTTSETRLTPDGAQVIIATRWHNEDLIGMVLKTARLRRLWRFVRVRRGAVAGTVAAPIARKATTQIRSIWLSVDVGCSLSAATARDDRQRMAAALLRKYLD